MWYIARDGSWWGPYSTEQILSQLKEERLSLLDYLWCRELGGDFKRAADLDAFRHLAPPAPASELVDEIQELTGVVEVPSSDTGLIKSGKVAWYIQYQKSEFGPMSFDEVQAVIKSGKLKGPVMVRQEGQSWRKAESLLAKFDTEKRSSRLAVFATVVIKSLHDLQEVGIGVCRDMSLTGMLVLSTSEVGVVGTSLHFQIVPIGVSEIAPFSVEGKIVRFLPRNKGFSVQFNPAKLELGTIKQFLRTQAGSEPKAG